MTIPAAQIHPHQGELASETSLRQIKHQPGVLVGNDAVPEFRAQTLPPGSAPKERTFQPTPQDEYPAASSSDAGEESARPQDTVTSSTSADVHEGIGKPTSGETRREEKDSQSSSKLGGVMAESTKNDPVSKRGEDRDHSKGEKLASDETEEGTTLLGAEDKEPVNAEDLAAEFDRVTEAK